jgi:hypothetical protein
VLFILPSPFSDGFVREWPTKTGTIPASVGSQPKGQSASHPGEGRQFFIAFDKADSDKDDLLSYLEIEPCWGSSSW